MLNENLFRAARVIIDIGMHLELEIPRGTGFHEGERWTPELGLEFMLTRTITEEALVRDEIDRYLGWPGQAPAYKLGERLWLSARDDARARAGRRLRPQGVPHAGAAHGPDGPGHPARAARRAVTDSRPAVVRAAARHPIAVSLANRLESVAPRGRLVGSITSPGRRSASAADAMAEVCAGRSSAAIGGAPAAACLAGHVIRAVGRPAWLPARPPLDPLWLSTRLAPRVQTVGVCRWCGIRRAASSIHSCACCPQTSCMDRELSAVIR